MLSEIGQRVSRFAWNAAAEHPCASQPNRISFCPSSIQKQNHSKVHGEAWKPAFTCWYARTSIYRAVLWSSDKRQRPSQLPPHGREAPERRRIGVLSISCISEETHYPPKDAAARKTHTSEMRAATFSSTISSTRAGMGDARLQGSRKALIPWLPEATTESYCEYVFIHKRLNRPQKGKTTDFLLKTDTFAAEVWQSAKIVFPRWARSTFFCHSRLAWELIFVVWLT